MIISLLTAAMLQVQPTVMPDWLSGSWAQSSANGWTEEWWSPPRAGLMLGAGRRGKGDTLGFFEYMRIERTAAGLQLCALPKGQAGGCFAAVAQDERSITFENRTHDYPQRIRYWREGAELRAEVSLGDGTEKQSWTFRPTSK